MCSWRLSDGLLRVMSSGEIKELTVSSRHEDRSQFIQISLRTQSVPAGDLGVPNPRRWVVEALS